MTATAEKPRQHQQNANMLGRPEPVLTRVFLPRCPSCEAPHPHALKLNQTTCQACGLERGAEKLDTETVPAVITGKGPAALLARACFAVAKFLANLAQRL